MLNCIVCSDESVESWTPVSGLTGNVTSVDLLLSPKQIKLVKSFLNCNNIQYSTTILNLQRAIGNKIFQSTNKNIWIYFRHWESAGGQETQSQAWVQGILRHRGWHQLVTIPWLLHSCQVNTGFSLVDTKLHSSLIGWHKAILISDWLKQSYSHLWLVDQVHGVSGVQVPGSGGAEWCWKQLRGSETEAGEDQQQQLLRVQESNLDRLWNTRARVDISSNMRLHHERAGGEVRPLLHHPGQLWFLHHALNESW